MRKLLALSIVAVTIGVTSTAQATSRNYWINKQIRIATKIGRESGADPWPNCPDPIWNGPRYTWQDTVNCENHGNWMDSPGYYRCGLQFDPGWERKYGKLCP